MALVALGPVTAGAVTMIEWRHRTFGELQVLCNLKPGEAEGRVCGSGWVPDVRGCYRMSGPVCLVYTRAPRHVWDDDVHRTLGHEVRHCFEGAFHP